VEESVRLLRAALPAGLRIEFSAATDTPAVMADPTQVQQVLLNLGANAAHAMEGRTGSIQIRVDGVTLDAALIRLESNLRPGRYARVAVSDTGHGMDERTQRRIFEPFFTTKPAGQGTGLGLTVAQGIMHAHAGVIIAHSEPGRGSRFELYFPCASGDVAGATPPEEPGEASEGHGQHILYIDDDEGQVFLNKRLLERWGYKVSAYIEQREALDVLLSGKVNFNLVITDYNMPGVSGLEIARAIREAKVEVPVIMVSGYVTDALRAQARTAGVRELLSKPSDAEEFRDAIHRVLAPAEATR
jgi:CheY-like chemotaxis protein